MSQTRRLAAILAADVAGYSRLIGADEEGTLNRLRSIRAELIDPKIGGASWANGEPVNVDYMMRRQGDSWLISDVYLDGAISEVATRRSEFAAILKSQGIDGLIAALNRKADILTATTSGTDFQRNGWKSRFERGAGRIQDRLSLHHRAAHQG
jgi:class 3 adenylate cyclase